MHKIGGFQDACAWPGKYFDRSTFTGKLNVIDMPQFKTDAYLTVMCETQDVTLAAASADWACESTATESFAANTLSRPAFDFGNYYETKKTLLFGAVGVGTVALHKIFLQGANPALDFAMAGLDYITYWAGATEFNAANGQVFEQKTILKGSKKDMTSAQQEKLDMFLKWGSEVTGYSNYRTRILMAFIELVSVYYDSSASTFKGKLGDLQSAALGWNYDNWYFKKLIDGNMMFDSEWYAHVDTYFYFYSIILQTFGVVMEGKSKSQWFPVDMVREIAYVYEGIQNSFYMI